MTYLWQLNIILEKVAEYEKKIQKRMPLDELGYYIDQNWILKNCRLDSILKLSNDLPFLLYDIKNKWFSLTDLGKEFLEKRNQKELNQLTQDQKKVVIDSLIKNNFFEKFEKLIVKRRNNFLLIRNDLKPYFRILVTLLKDIGLLDDLGEENYLTLSNSYNKYWNKIFSESTLTEEDLFLIIEKQKIIGRQGEEIAFEYEKREVLKYEDKTLHDKVKLISLQYVDRGYDIASINEDGTPKYIEVKTTTHKFPRFFISRNEYNASKRYEKNYWIYFVILNNNQIIKFNNIPQKVELGHLILEPSHFESLINLKDMKYEEIDFI